MKGPLRIRTARPGDEPVLRALTEVEMPGAVKKALPQAPNFFAAEAVRGETRLGVLTDDSDGVLGCGARVVRRAWLGGAWRRTGYYCTLRATPAGRNARAIKVAYSWAREVERTDPLPIITSTILSENGQARRLLTSRRLSLPAYLDAGEITTFTMGWTPPRDRRHSCEVLVGTEVGLDRLRAFYHDPRGMQPLFPKLPDPLPATLALDDFIVLRSRGEIVAAAAVWNQRTLRQVRITGYTPPLGALRPLVNLFCAWRGLPRLPRPGRDVPLRYFAFRKQRTPDPRVFRALLREAARRLPRGDLLTFSLHQDDPLFAESMRLRAFRTKSRLYTISYADDPRPFAFAGAPYIEAAML